MTELWQQELPYLGKVFFSENNIHLSGVTMLKDYKCYIKVISAHDSADNKVGIPKQFIGKLYNSEYEEFSTDPELIAEMNRRIELTEQIENARKQQAKKLANGNKILETIFKLHICFTDGEIRVPYIFEDIKFYQVGRNATHVFYLGGRNGKLYRYSSCGLFYDKNEGYFADEAVDEYYHEVENLADEYIGHH